MKRKGWWYIVQYTYLLFAYDCELLWWFYNKKICTDYADWSEWVFISGWDLTFYPLINSLDNWNENFISPKLDLFYVDD